MKRMLIFSVAYHPLVGGAEVAVKEITNRIPSREVSFEMVTLRFSETKKEERVGNVFVRRLVPPIVPAFLRKLLFPFVSLYVASRLHRQKSFDAIWAIMASYAGFGALFFKLLHPRVPFLLTLQEGDPIPEIKRKVMLLYPLFRMIFTRADRIQAISNYLAGWAREMGARCFVTVVPNGVDLVKFQIPNSKSPACAETASAGSQINSNTEIPNYQVKRQRTRNELRYKDSDVVLVTTSRLVPKNGVGDIIEAMRLLDPRVKLLIVGSGNLEFDLKMNVQYRKLEDRVKFLGFIPHETLPSYLSASDIFVRPSLSEGMGNSFIEAMASGLPVIATPVGGIVDFLKDKETGVFCEPRNPKSIAEAVNLLMRDGALREEIIQNASRVVLEKYDWSNVLREMRKFLQIDKT